MGKELIWNIKNEEKVIGYWEVMDESILLQWLINIPEIEQKDSFHIACERIKKGGIFCDNYIKFFNDFVSFTRDYAKKLITLTKSQQEDIGSTNLGWLGIKQGIFSVNLKPKIQISILFTK